MLRKHSDKASEHAVIAYETCMPWTVALAEQQPTLEVSPCAVRTVVAHSKYS